MSSKSFARRNPDFAMRASGARAAVRDSGGSAPHSSARFDDGEAFLHDPHGGPARTREVLAEKLAEGFVFSATNAQGLVDDARELTQEDLAGLSVRARANAPLFAGAVDARPVPLDVVLAPMIVSRRHY